MPLRRNIFYFLFALSGFTGLIYESIWTHYLKLFLGHAAYAQTLVLAIFMGGLALGSWLCSKYSGRWTNLLKGYAVIEGIIGLSALIFHNVFGQAIQFSYSDVIPDLGSPMAIDLFKWTLSAFLILPQTILLGMTFPLMTAGLIRMFPEDSGRSVSMLYFTNSLGAALGVLTSGFVLVRLVGLPGTIRIAGLINVGLGIYVWLLVRGFPPAESLKSGPIPSVAGDNSGRRWYWSLLAASGVTGAASFIYEIGWIRMLSLVLGSSTHAFELMLSAFISGLAFGGLWMRQRIGRISDRIIFLVKVQILMGLLALLTLPLYGSTFVVMDWLIRVLPMTNAGYALFNLSSSGLALMIMFPTTFLAGMTLPLITSSLLQRGFGERSIGAVYAVNTVGAIIGVFFAVHIGMPVLGLKGLIIVGAGLDIMLGLALLWSSASVTWARRFRVLVAILSVTGLLLFALFVELDAYNMASGVYRSGGLISKKAGLLFHKDGKTATVSVLEGGTSRDIRTNGKIDAAMRMDTSLPVSGDESTMVLLALLPLSVNPQAKKVAAIGFGAGLTTATYLLSDTVDEVDTIEIEPAMVEGARNFLPIVEKAYSDPRSRIYIDDAKTFFSSHNKKYDIILSEPSNPWVSGVSGLFSQEFYHFIGEKLTNNGIFCQWLQLYEIDVNLVATVLKALSVSFKDYVIYALEDTDLIIIAGNGPRVPEPDFRIADNPDIAKALKWINVNNLGDLRIRLIGGRQIFDDFLKTLPVEANSDYHPVLDQNAARARFLHSEAAEFSRFAFKPLPVAQMLRRYSSSRDITAISPALDFEGSLAGFVAAGLRDYYTRGDFPEEYANIAAGIRGKAVELKELFFTQCRAGSDERTAQMYDTIAVRMIPFLSPPEMDKIWAALESGSCMGSFTERDREWISLLKAIGRRDAASMAGLSESLLQKEQGLPKGPLSYLVATGMLGRLMQEDREGSLALWNKYRQGIYGEAEPSFFFRVLAAMSTKG